MGKRARKRKQKQESEEISAEIGQIRSFARFIVIQTSQQFIKKTSQSCNGAVVADNTFIHDLI